MKGGGYDNFCIERVFDFNGVLTAINGGICVGSEILEVDEGSGCYILDGGSSILQIPSGGGGYHPYSNVEVWLIYILLMFIFDNSRGGR